MNINEELKLKLPLFQAPLDNYPNQEALIANISNHGGLGVYNTCFKTMDNIASGLEQIHAQTNHAFAVMIDMTEGDDSLDLADRSQVNAMLSKACNDLNLDHHDTPSLPSHDQIIDYVIKAQPAAIIFRNGLAADKWIKTCQDNDIITMAVVSNTLEALVADKVVDVLILQGFEAAGIHSHFPNDINTTLYSASTLLHHALANTTKPLVLWGDCQFPQHVVAALINGAAAVMIDTLLWTTEQSPIPAAYRQALTQHNEMQTPLNQAWFGYSARTLNNTLSQTLQQQPINLPIRKQQRLLLPIIEAAILQNHADYMPLWAGTCAVTTNKDVKTLCEQFLAELNEMIN